jgi:hypothetical protein
MSELVIEYENSDAKTRQLKWKELLSLAYYSAYLILCMRVVLFGVIIYLGLHETWFFLNIIEKILTGSMLLAVSAAIPILIGRGFGYILQSIHQCLNSWDVYKRLLHKIGNLSWSFGKPDQINSYTWKADADEKIVVRIDDKEFLDSIQNGSLLLSAGCSLISRLQVEMKVNERQEVTGIEYSVPKVHFLQNLDGAISC